jgi:hypothetical protein
MVAQNEVRGCRRQNGVDRDRALADRHLARDRQILRTCAEGDSSLGEPLERE